VSAPRRIQRRRTKGWKLPEGCVVVTRPTKWGNPWRVRARLGTVEFVSIPGVRCGFPAAPITLDDVLVAYESHLRLSVGPSGFTLAVEARTELRGRDLACFCALPKDGEPDRCHAAVLLRVANEEDPFTTRRRREQGLADLLGVPVSKLYGCSDSRGRGSSEP